MENNPTQPVSAPTIAVPPANQPTAAPTSQAPKTPHLGNKELVETVIALLTTNSISDAARKLGVNRTTIYDRKEKWNLDEVISEIPLQALQALQGSSLKAAMNMIEDLDSYRPKIRQDASKYILDKALPQQPTTQVTIQNNLMSMNDFVLAMKQRKDERVQKEHDY